MKNRSGGEPPGLLISAPNWLGDLVMSTALIEALARPELGGGEPAVLKVSAPRAWLPLLHDDPRIDTLLGYDRGATHDGLRGSLRLAGQWRRTDCGTALLLPPSLRVALVAALAAIPRRIGFRGDGRALLLSRAVSRPGRGDLHYIDELARLIEVWSGRDRPPAMPWPSLPGCAALPRADLGPTPAWALAIGTTYGEAKSWPVDRIVAFVDRAVAEMGVRILLLGDAKARDAAREISGRAKVPLRSGQDSQPGIVDLVGATDLPGVVSILKSVRLFLGGDSGLMHLSAALGTPTAGLFGSTNPCWTAPRGPRVKVVRAPYFPCQPCYKRVCDQAEFCLDKLEPATVLEACRGLLDGESGDSAGVYRPVDDGPQPRPTIFVDRDGVLLEDTGYISDPAQARLLDGVVPALEAAARAGYRIICLTNQSGIGRALYSRSDFAAVQARLDELLAAGGVRLDGTYYCPHAPQDECDCRKPATGMISAAARDCRWSPGAWMIGDKASDIRLAERAGLRPVLVLTGEGAAQREQIDPARPVVADLGEAIEGILQGRWR